MMLFEEDDFILDTISILNLDFSMAIHPTAPSPTRRMRANYIPQQYFDYSKSVGGVDNCPGYASGGGTANVKFKVGGYFEKL